MTSFYDRTAEYVAVLIPAAWNGLDAALSAALEGLDITTGPVVDVGAGTGTGTDVLARALPGAEIIAVEPHHALRTALLARVAGDEDLRARVTVLESDLLSAALPKRIAGLVAMNVIGHFAPADRLDVWTLLADRLAPGGRAVLNLYPPTRPVAVPAIPLAEVTLGRRRYTGSAAAEPAGPDAVIWHMTYSVNEDSEQVTEFTASDRWYVINPEQLGAELAEHGLQLTPGDPAHSIQVINRRGSR